MSYYYYHPDRPATSYAAVAAGSAPDTTSAPVTRPDFAVQPAQSFSAQKEVKGAYAEEAAEPEPAKFDGKPGVQPPPGAYYYYTESTPYAPLPPVYRPTGAPIYPGNRAGEAAQPIRYQYDDQTATGQVPPSHSRSEVSQGICNACVRGMGWGAGMGLAWGCVFGLCNLF